MSKSIDKSTTQAMALSGEARALLAERLVESLDQESVSKIWLDEAKKRRDEVLRGEVQPIPGLAVMEEVRKLIDDK
ncbi:acyl-protein synthetase [Chlorobaculum thiosulfatiphilum]|uniref:Acyl-protein synthetase n=1 Tax=Chlorobaculum thiosulfatiphilum TaxID=115852 RepID=A0A5C4SA45_CHLTI|nr:addiction module protein [Chlorobaculum thiosulfatiphilum]TNJ40433.1 acyl-protein synthetase [Chlorobaculum thiosulfatiphilum]